ncbi:MAG: metallophosphoesterase, partial [Trueperaceae bacterium]
SPGQEAKFSWSLSSAGSGALSCTLDIDDDGVIEYSLPDCEAVTRLGHSYSSEGVFSARLRVEGGAGASVDAVVQVAVVSTALTPYERVHIFYYPWYGNPEFDLGSSGTNREGWRHWQQNFGSLARTPPEDIGSSFYPSLSAYSSSDPSLIDQHMRWIAEAGIGVVVVSWSGRDSFTDQLVPALLDGAATHGLKIAFHLEPNSGDSAEAMIDNIDYIYSAYGRHPAFFWVNRPSRHGPSSSPRGVFYVFDVLAISPLDEWRRVLDGIRGTSRDAFVVAQRVSPNPVEEGHFDGVYTYDVYAVEGEDWEGFNRRIAGSGGVFSPSVGPGFDEARAIDGSTRIRSREDGSRYDTLWARAIASGSEWISITSFNEWHEGTQLEPAVAKSIAGYDYETYEGAYGLSGPDAEHAYLKRTRYWLDRLSQAPFDIAVNVFPPAATLPAGESMTLVSAVAGSGASGVTWDVEAGSLSGSGHTVTYTAPVTAGTYAVTATSVTDPTKSATAELLVTAVDGGVFETRIASGREDAEERDSGDVSFSSSDLELTFDPNAESDLGSSQLIGLRFSRVAIPAGARITEAHIQFTVDEESGGEALLVIQVQATDDAPLFEERDRSLSEKSVTANSVTWSPEVWRIVGESGPAQRTPDLSALVQEVVDRPGWSPGNAVAFLISGTGRRVAESYDGDPIRAPRLHVEYTVGGRTSVPAEATTTDNDLEPSAASVTFAAAGDFGGKDSRGGTVLRDLSSRNTAAFFLVGDISYDELSAVAWCDWVHGYLGESYPMELLVGNHEEDSRVDGFIRDFTACMPDRLGSDLGPGGYGVNYAFDLGPVTVIGTAPDIVVDGVGYRYEVGSAERRWLVDTIRTAKSEGDWVVVGFHKVCISIGTKSCETGESFAQLLIDEGVDLALSGHEHDYMRSHSLAVVQRNTVPVGAVADDGSDNEYARGAGTVFVIAGTAGRSLRPCSHADSEAGYFAAHHCGEESEDTKGYLLMTASQTKFEAQFIATVGSYTDVFTIE